MNPHDRWNEIPRHRREGLIVTIILVLVIGAQFI